MAIYVLPMVVFCCRVVAVDVFSMALGRPVLYHAGGGHLTQIIFGTLVWAFIAEHYRVTDFDELFRSSWG